VLRQAEIRRREILAEPARPAGQSPKATATVEDVLAEVRKLRPEVLACVKELADRMAALEAAVPG
jgi:hypothetical protein